MSWTIQDLADAGLELLREDPALTVHDGKVPAGSPDHYVLVRTYRMLQGGLVAPDKTRLTGSTRAVEMQMYCYSVGPTAASSRAVAGRVESRLLDVVPVVAGRTCFPIRWADGQPTDRDEETLRSVFTQVDVYGWTSVPG